MYEVVHSKSGLVLKVGTEAACQTHKDRFYNGQSWIVVRKQGEEETKPAKKTTKRKK